MTDKQEKFLRLAVVEGKKYDEIQEILGVNRKDFAPWWNEFKKERELLTLIRKKWKAKCPELDFEIFENWFINSEKKCFYCKITENEIDQLWKKYPVLTKRKRGKSLEIERLDPNQEYTKINNLVFSCYWCNNAKTDTFSKEEFKKLGLVIQEIWKERLR